MTEESATYQFEQPAKSRTLFAISNDLEKLGKLLDECGDDTQQRELIDSWFEYLGTEREHSPMKHGTKLEMRW